MAFSGYEFHPLALLTDEVPILTCGGLAKKYLVPGWRVGWIVLYDKHNYLNQVRKGIVNCKIELIQYHS
jgi:tyrosine aminotransferase